MNINDLRFKQKEKTSAVKLFRKAGISDLERIEEKTKLITIMSLARVISQYTNHEGVNIYDEYEKFYKKVELYAKTYFIQHKIDKFNIKSCESAISNIYQSLTTSRKPQEYVGILVEYFLLRLVKNKSNKVRHECKIYYKRKSLQSNNVKIKDKVLDLIRIHKKNKIDLFECKANLHSEFKALSVGKNGRLKYKLKLMEHLNQTLKQCQSSLYAGFTEIESYLVTVVKPMNQVDLTDRFSRNIKVIAFEDLITNELQNKKLY